jgi:chemotaxis protein histidine kinase CheA
VKQTLNGEIEVSSEEGKGLSYMIRFPKTLQQPTNMFD